MQLQNTSSKEKKSHFCKCLKPFLKTQSVDLYITQSDDNILEQMLKGLDKKVSKSSVVGDFCKEQKAWLFFRQFPSIRE